MLHLPGGLSSKTAVVVRQPPKGGESLSVMPPVRVSAAPAGTLAVVKASEVARILADLARNLEEAVDRPAPVRRVTSAKATGKQPTIERETGRRALAAPHP